MGTKGPNMQSIQIMVTRDRIELGERYACSVSLDSGIEWTCEHPFSLRCDWDAPFQLHATGKKSAVLRFKAGVCLQPNHPYAYTIAAFVNGQVISDKAIIIVKPPKPEPLPSQRYIMGPLPGTIIIKPRRP